MTLKPSRNWVAAGVKNGALLGLIDDKFDFFITVDRNLVYQQPKQPRGFGIIVIATKTNRYAEVSVILKTHTHLIEQENIGKVLLIPHGG